MIAEKEFKRLLVYAARRCVSKHYPFQYIDNKRLSEAEVRYVLCKIFYDKHILHGIEMPTKFNEHQFTGTVRKRCALVDLVLYDNSLLQQPMIWVELKRGQVKIENIEKDFTKMLLEPAIGGPRGVCFFHILPTPKKNATRARKLELRQSNIVKRYSKVCNATKKSGHIDRWFVLFILDSKTGQYYYVYKPNLYNIESLSDGEQKGIPK